MFHEAIKTQDSWSVLNSRGHSLVLPARADYAGFHFAIGVLGTRTRAAVKGAKTSLMADLLASLSRPVYLIDTRRNGVGAQSSWSPREFATVIPELIGDRVGYEYLHVPCLAPTVALLNAERKQQIPSWHDFRQQYVATLSPAHLSVGRAFVETSASDGGIAIFLCAEADQPEFDRLSLADQNSHYCHRFTLAKWIASDLRSAYTGVTVELVHLDMLDFQEHRESGREYQPRTETVPTG